MSVENLIKSFCRTIHKFCLKPSRSKQTERRQTKKSDKDFLFVHIRLAQTDLMADGSLYTAEGTGRGIGLYFAISSPNGMSCLVHTYLPIKWHVRNKMKRCDHLVTLSVHPLPTRATHNLYSLVYLIVWGVAG